MSTAHGPGRKRHGQRHRPPSVAGRYGRALASQIAGFRPRACGVMFLQRGGMGAHRPRAQYGRGAERYRTRQDRASTSILDSVAGSPQTSRLSAAAMGGVEPFVMGVAEVNGPHCPQPSGQLMTNSDHANFRRQAGISPRCAWFAGFDDPASPSARSCSLPPNTREHRWGPGRTSRSANPVYRLRWSPRPPATARFPPKWPSGGTAKRAQGKSNRRVRKVSGSRVAPDPAPGGWRWQPPAVIFLQRENARPTRMEDVNACRSRPNHRNPLPRNNPGGRPVVEESLKPGSPRTAGRSRRTMRQSRHHADGLCP